jgi:hypothetical protein
VAAVAVLVNAHVRFGEYSVPHQCVALTGFLALCLAGVQAKLPRAAPWAGPLAWALALSLGLGSYVVAGDSDLGKSEPLARDFVLRRTATAGHLARIPWSILPAGSLLESSTPDEALLAKLYDPRQGTVPNRPQEKPDILLITVCTVRANHLGFNSYSRDTSPNLDRLAAQSVNFSRTYTSGPKTRHSLPATLSGSYTASYFLGSKRPSLEALLRKLAGYKVHNDSASAVAARGQGRPVLLRVHFNDAHNPYTPASPRFGTTALDLYDAELREMDAKIGAVVDSFPGALVAIVSDHGEEFGDHRGRFHRFGFHDEVMRGVFLIRAPGLHPRRIDVEVSAASMTPTVLELVGVEPPPSVEAWSVLPLARGQAQPQLPPIVVSTPIWFRPGGWGPPPHVKTMLVEDRWKLIYDSIHGAAELYDLRKDPREQQNVFGQHPERQARLLRILATYRKYISARASLPPDWFR